MGKTNLPSDRGNQHPLAELIVLYMEGVLSDSQQISLRSQLKQHGENRALFVDLMLQRCGIVRLLSREAMAADPFADGYGSGAAVAPDAAPESTDVLRIVDPRELHPKPPRIAPTQPVAHAKAAPTRWPGGVWLIAAGILLLVAAVAVLRPFFSSPAPQPPVATVVASSGAQWEGGALSPAARIPYARSLGLTTGVVELAFSGGAKVVVEAPARFTLDSSTAISLASGKLTARVKGGGFVVKTPTARITDLGTEFGISVNADGSTAVDVFKGRVQVAPLAPALVGSPATLVTAGQAVLVSANGVQADAAGAAPQRFIRSLSADVASLDVVDLVAGGDGTTHRSGLGIDAATGKAGPLPQVASERGDHAYHRVPGFPVVDGCFIPDGSRGPMQTDSSGHRFAFPATIDVTFNLIWAGGPIPAGDKRSGTGRAMSTVLDGVDYSKPGHACLAMHPNKGLTLDLDEVRRLHPLSGFSRLTCTVGNTWAPLPENRVKPPLPAKFYVLIDGQQRLTLTIQASGAHVEVPLGRSDRFLTLVTADGGTDISASWILVADPVLDLAVAQKAQQ